MSHEIDITNGIAAFADSRNDAWHGLGQQVGHVMSAEEALREAHLAGWNVRKEPLFAAVARTVDSDDGLTSVADEPEMVLVEDKFATVRTNPISKKPEVLGTVGRNYHVIQNEAVTDFIDALADESGAHFETAGSLRGGREVFVTMKFPNSMQLTTPNGTIDTTDLYVAALNSHDGGTPFRVIVTPVRILCANTQGAALGNLRSSWSARHTINALNVIEEARQALGMAHRFIDAFQTEADRMIQAVIDEDYARKVIGEVFDVAASELTERAQKGRAGHVDRIMDLYNTSATLTDVRGTRYGVYNALTEYVDHFWPKGGEAVGVPAASQVFGQYADLKADTFKRLLVKA